MGCRHRGFESLRLSELFKWVKSPWICSAGWRTCSVPLWPSVLPVVMRDPAVVLLHRHDDDTAFPARSCGRDIVRTETGKGTARSRRQLWSRHVSLCPHLLWGDFQGAEWASFTQLPDIPQPARKEDSLLASSWTLTDWAHQQADPRILPPTISSITPLLADSQASCSPQGQQTTTYHHPLLKGFWDSFPKKITFTFTNCKHIHHKNSPRWVVILWKGINFTMAHSNY